MAILCENLLEASLKDFEKLQQLKVGLKTRLAKMRRAARDKEGRWAPEGGCIACKSSRSSEQHYLSALEEWLHDEDFAERFNQSTGLSLLHIRVASEQWPSGPALEAIRHVAKKQIGPLLQELREFRRKHDCRFKPMNHAALMTCVNAASSSNGILIGSGSSNRTHFDAGRDGRRLAWSDGRR